MARATKAREVEVEVGDDVGARRVLESFVGPLEPGQRVHIRVADAPRASGILELRPLVASRGVTLEDMDDAIKDGATRGQPRGR